MRLQTLTVPPAPNLQVSSISNPPATLTQGGSFSLTNSVRNVGSAGAGTTDTKYYLVSIVDGTKKDLQGTQVVPALNGGQTFSTQQTLTVREETLRGQYKVQACADGGNDAVESLEDDNCLTSGGIVKVVGPPDLIVTLVTVKNAPLSVARGGLLTITAAVKNQGEGDAPPSTLKFRLVNTVSGAPKNLDGTKDYALIKPGTTSTQQRIVTVFLDTDGRHLPGAGLRRLPRQDPGGVRDQQLPHLDRDHHGAVTRPRTARPPSIRERRALANGARARRVPPGWPRRCGESPRSTARVTRS